GRQVPARRSARSGGARRRDRARRARRRAAARARRADVRRALRSAATEGPMMRTTKRRRFNLRATALGPGIAVLVSANAPARDAPPAHTYGLDEAVADALATHPRLATARAEERAADARIDEARTLLLPSAGISAEINRSTGNTVPGAFFTAPGFVPVAGAPRG